MGYVSDTDRLDVKRNVKNRELQKYQYWKVTVGTELLTSKIILKIKWNIITKLHPVKTQPLQKPKPTPKPKESKNFKNKGNNIGRKTTSLPPLKYKKETIWIKFKPNYYQTEPYSSKISFNENLLKPRTNTRHKQINLNSLNFDWVELSFTYLLVLRYFHSLLLTFCEDKLILFRKQGVSQAKGTWFL